MRFTGEKQRPMFLGSFFATETRKLPFCAAQRSDQTGWRGTCSCCCSVPALHHNKGNLNAFLFYVLFCKILQGYCGPYKIESCQMHREKAGVSIESDGLFMLASLGSLLCELNSARWCFRSAVSFCGSFAFINCS